MTSAARRSFLRIVGVVLVGVFIGVGSLRLMDREVSAPPSGGPAPQARAGTSSTDPVIETTKTSAGRHHADHEMGRLELRFVDLAGDPVDGVSVRLHHPDGTTIDSVSDVDGIGLREILEPGEGYRWSLESNHRVDMAPPFEVPEWSEPERGELVRNDGYRRNLSGAITIEAGRTSSYEVRVTPGAHVTGFFGSFHPELHASVRLFSVRKNPMRRIQTARTRTDENDFFEFRDVEPGLQLIRGYSRRSDDSVVFGSVEFELQPGEERHLGEITPASGASIAVEIRLTDNGNSTLPVTRYSETSAPRVRLSIINRDPTGSTVAGANDILTVPVGAITTLHGIVDDTCTLFLNEHDLSPVRAGAHIDFGERVELRSPFPSHVALPIRIIERRTVTLDLAFPGFLERPLECEVRAVSTNGRIARSRIVPDGDSLSQRARLELPADSYRVLVFSSPHADSEESVYYRGRLEVDSDAPVATTFALQPGCSIAGTVTGPDGEPLASRVVFFRYEWWPGRAHTYVTETDDDGRYVLHGLIPGETLRAHGSLPTIHLGAAGTTQVRDVVIEDP